MFRNENENIQEEGSSKSKLIYTCSVSVWEYLTRHSSFSRLYMHGLCTTLFLSRGSKGFLSLQCDRSLAGPFPLLTVGLFGRMALDGIRMPDGCYADGTWELKMHVTDLHRDVSLRVTGEIHIGGVMLKLVEKLGMDARCCHIGARAVFKEAYLKCNKQAWE